LASALKQHAQLSLFITVGDYGLRREDEADSSNTFVRNLPHLKHNTTSTVSSSSQCGPLQEICGGLHLGGKAESCS